MKFFLIILFFISFSFSNGLKAYKVVQEWCKCSDIRSLPDNDDFKKIYRFIVFKDGYIVYVKVEQEKIKLTKIIFK